MRTGGELPCTVVLCVSADCLEVLSDVEPPSNGPVLKFWLQFRPLLFHTAGVLSLVVEEQGCGLNQALDEQNLVR